MDSDTPTYVLGTSSVGPRRGNRPRPSGCKNRSKVTSLAKLSDCTP